MTFVYPWLKAQVNGKFLSEEFKIQKFVLKERIEDREGFIYGHKIKSSPSNSHLAVVIIEKKNN